MKSPPRRIEIPPRRRENRKKKLFDFSIESDIGAYFDGLKYSGHGKHKSNPHIYGLEPYHGRDGDRTLCDQHAGFSKKDMGRIPDLVNRARSAKLAGTDIWTIDDNGWIYELALTNETQKEYHGYPVRPPEAIAQKVYERFRAWAFASGTERDKDAARACESLYGFRQ